MSRRRRDTRTSPPRRPSPRATRTPSASSRSSARPSTAATSRSRRSTTRSTSSRQDKGCDIPIHVDGASGGVHRAVHRPRARVGLPRAASAARSTRRATSTASCIPGVGWIIWRDADDLPEDLVFNVDYLGGSDADVRAELLPPGRAGGRAVLQLPAARLRRLPRRSSSRVATPRCGSRPSSRAMGPFELRSDGGELPVFAVRLTRRRDRLHRVRHLRSAAHARLARAGLPHAPRHRRHGGAPRRGAQRVRPRPRGHARSPTSNGRSSSSRSTAAHPA